MGYNKRQEAREISNSIAAANKRIEGATLGELCADGLVKLNVACIMCLRRGCYRITRLIDAYGPGLQLSRLAEILSADCPNRHSFSHLRPCGINFPEAKAGLKPKG